jgi:hypothetical protein
MEYRIPAVNWADELSSALRSAAPGDVVIVRTERMLQLAESAAARMGKEGVTLTKEDPNGAQDQ